MLADISQDLRILKALCTIASNPPGQALLEFLQASFEVTARFLAHDSGCTTAQAYKMHGHMQCLDEIIFQLRNASDNYQAARLIHGLDHAEFRGGKNKPAPDGSPATGDIR